MSGVPRGSIDQGGDTVYKIAIIPGENEVLPATWENLPVMLSRVSAYQNRSVVSEAQTFWGNFSEIAINELTMFAREKVWMNQRTTFECESLGFTLALFEEKVEELRQNVSRWNSREGQLERMVFLRMFLMENAGLNPLYVGNGFTRDAQGMPHNQRKCEKIGSPCNTQAIQAFPSSGFSMVTLPNMVASWPTIPTKAQTALLSSPL